ncbi:MAG TPA: Fe-S cluster assembly protein SufD [Patescibacteria group bacterium]|nr:Fe-S cluster assembly protein SufD [Patescibacteria group bacterium]
MTATAGKESFMAQAPQLAAAMPWLDAASALQKDNAENWIKALRSTGAESFAQTGLPTPAWEGWQYTNLRALNPAKFHYTSEPVKFDATKIPAPLLGTHRIVLVNGQYQPSLSSLPTHVTVMSVMEAAEKKVEGLEEQLVTLGDLAQMPLVALNAAYTRDGFVMQVARGKDVTEPVEVLYYNAGREAAAYPRVLYKLGENSGLAVIERHCGEGEYLANSYAAISLESASRMRFYRFEEESDKAFHFSHVTVQQQKDSSFEGFSLASGGRLAREEFRLQLIDKAISSSIGGTYLMRGQQSHDFTVLADHFEPDGKSVQLFKGVVDDQARAVFQGKIHVRRSAQKTDGYQSHHALLLSATAEASAKPELEIYADDVKCSHGATAGQLNPEALFYLRSRGIPLSDAKSLMVESFLAGAIEKVSHEQVRDIYLARVSAWLAGRGA